MSGGDLVDAFRETAVQAQRDLIEEVCEKSLLDKQARGVLVVRHQNGITVSARLSTKVPWGHVFDVPAGTDAEAMYSDPVDGLTGEKQR